MNEREAVHSEGARVGSIASRPLRVGVIAPPWLAIPPTGYGGTEVVIDMLCRGLQRAGHEVVLFTTGDSTCPVDRRFVLPVAPGVDVGGSAVELQHVVSAYAALRDVDVIHDHTTIGPVYAMTQATVPVVTTNHNPFAEPFSTMFRAVGKTASVVAISAHHAATAGDVPLAAVIHHGIDPEAFPVGSGTGRYALFLGRMTPEKGAHRAIVAATAAGMRLVLAGTARSASERQYLDEQVMPLLSDRGQYVGEIDQSSKVELLGGAACLLNPIAWPEPFGMVMIEAFACGTPVVTLRAGAVPEIVADGVTGLICDDETELPGALARVAELDRAACRGAVEGHFSAARMVADHVALYRRVLAEGPLR
jgi:glycosyltransferase involved in cell wall biosynthesis